MAMPPNRDGYDPEWIELEKAMGTAPPLPEEQLAARAAFNGMLVQLSQQLPPTDPNVVSRDEQISPEVTVRIYTPSKSAGEAKQPLPLFVYCKGGGWQCGNLDTEDHLCKWVCAQVPCMVVSVDYRLYPEEKFPVPIDDCYLGYQWAYDHADELGADKSRCAIGGGSAGGAPAVAIPRRLIKDGQRERIAGVVSLAGMIVHPSAVPEKYAHLHKSSHELPGDVAPVVTLNMILDAYEKIVGAAGYKDPDWFPVAGGAGEFEDFPRVYIANSEMEALRDDGLILEEELKDAGVPVRRDFYPGLPHYFWCFPLQNAGAKFRNNLVAGLRWIFE